MTRDARAHFKAWGWRRNASSYGVMVFSDGGWDVEVGLKG